MVWLKMQQPRRSFYLKHVLEYIYTSRALEAYTAPSKLQQAFYIYSNSTSILIDVAAWIDISPFVLITTIIWVLYFYCSSTTQLEERIMFYWVSGMNRQRHKWVTVIRQ